MRYVRIPYCYMTDFYVVMACVRSVWLLDIIYDVHHDIPNVKWHLPYVKAFMYHPSFLRWCHVKSAAECDARKINHPNLKEKHINMLSRPLSEFVPPTDAEIAEDVVWLLQQWAAKPHKGGQKLPYSYVELAIQHYGYHPEPAAEARIAQSAGGHRDADRDWYLCSSEEAAKVNPHPMAGRVRRGADGR